MMMRIATIVQSMLILPVVSSDCYLRRINPAGLAIETRQGDEQLLLAGCARRTGVRIADRGHERLRHRWYRRRAAQRGALIDQLVVDGARRVVILLHHRAVERDAREQALR